jgi:hypothetical protein
MHLPTSLLFTSLVTLLNLGSFVSANPVPQDTIDTIANLSSPNPFGPFSDCTTDNIAIDSLTGFNFTLYVDKEYIPFQSFNVFLRSTSAKGPFIPYLSQQDNRPPRFSVGDFGLTQTFVDGRSYLSHFTPTKNPLIIALSHKTAKPGTWFFGGDGEEWPFAGYPVCDIFGELKIHLRTGVQGMLFCLTSNGIDQLKTPKKGGKTMHHLLLTCRSSDFIVRDFKEGAEIFSQEPGPAISKCSSLCRLIFCRLS